MKNFTLLLVMFVITMTAQGQKLQNLILKHKNVQEQFSAGLKQANGLLLPLDQKSALATQALDSVISQIYVAETDSWKDDTKDEYQYDSELKNTGWTGKKWIDSISMWKVVNQLNIGYNENDQVILLESYDANETGDLVLTNKTEAFYGAAGLLDSVLHSWRAGENTWTSGGKQTYHYDESNRLTQMDLTVVAEPEEEGEEETTYILSYFYSYTDDGQLEVKRVNIIEGDLQIPYSETKYFYDSSFRRIAEETKDVNMATFLYENSSRTEYEFNEAGDVTTETSFLWDRVSSDWVEDEKDEFTYSNISFSDVAIPSFFQLLGIDDILLSFINAVSEVKTYSWMDNEWVLTDRTLHYYSSGGPSTGINHLTHLNISAYPNPASDKVRFKWQGYSFLSLELYNIAGIKVLDKQIFSEMDVPLASLTKGTYLFRLSDDNKTLYSGKLIKK